MCERLKGEKKKKTQMNVPIGYSKWSQLIIDIIEIQIYWSIQPSWQLANAYTHSFARWIQTIHFETIYTMSFGQEFINWKISDWLFPFVVHSSSSSSTTAILAIQWYCIDTSICSLNGVNTYSKLVTLLRCWWYLHRYRKNKHHTIYISST